MYFLNADYNIEPPKGIPLWFHYGTTFFDRDIKLYTQMIKTEKGSYTFVQEIVHNDKIKDFFANK